jgi:hypothetical protein
VLLGGRFSYTAYLISLLGEEVGLETETTSGAPTIC